MRHQPRMRLRRVRCWWLTLQPKWHQPRTQECPLCDPKVTSATSATARGSAAGTSALVGSKESRRCSPESLARSRRSHSNPKRAVSWICGTCSSRRGGVERSRPCQGWVPAPAYQGEQPSPAAADKARGQRSSTSSGQPWS